ncbi:MAG: M20/M25/M40 family metallo-hydrolase, partial [Bacteroidales bacterium]|nr:M20/M25/M40 family metallo-hydrolase [Bacteroidales bacterium]
MKKLIFAFVFLFNFLSVFAQNPEITQAELKEYISYLSSDELKGRKPGTEGGMLAAKYIEEYFKKIGLKPFGKLYFQYFDVVTQAKADAASSFKVGSFSARLNHDFIPLTFSSEADLNADVVFAGYGFDIASNDIQWNDYEGIDVKGKWVLILRADPELDNPDSKFIPYSKERSKVLTAKEKGAAGVIFVSGIELDKKDKLIKLVADQTESNFGLPVVHIKRAVADKILKKSGKTIEDLEKLLNTNKKPNSFDCETDVFAHTKINFEKVKTQNVVAYIKGSDKKLRNEYIVVGAHYDHLGMGGWGSSSRMPDSIGVHHGADDNASGVASVMEIAEKLVKNKKKLKRSIIFVAFSAEEIGLIGSKYFTEHPPVNIKDIKAMVNIDMVGRLKPSKELSVGGVGTSIEGEDLLNKYLNGYDLKLGISYEGFGPSDHASFYIKDIPVFFFSTGAHEDYHTPLDVVEKVNFNGLKNLDDYIYDLTVNLANRDKDLT